VPISPAVLAVGGAIAVILSMKDVLRVGALTADEDGGETKVLLVMDGLRPKVDDDATKPIPDVDVEFAATERMTGSEVVTLTEGNIVIEETGKKDVDAVDILGLRLNVDCDVLLTDSVGLCETMTLGDVDKDDNDGSESDDV